MFAIYVVYPHISLYCFVVWTCSLRTPEQIFASDILSVERILSLYIYMCIAPRVNGK